MRIVLSEIITLLQTGSIPSCVVGGSPVLLGMEHALVLFLMPHLPKYQAIGIGIYDVLDVKLSLQDETAMNKLVFLAKFTAPFSLHIRGTHYKSCGGTT